MFGFALPIIPFILMLVFNILPPKEVNVIYDYRTPRSQKTLENWREANKYWGRLMLKSSGVILILILCLVISYFAKKYINIIVIISNISVVLFLFIPIILTEIHLRNYHKEK